MKNKYPKKDKTLFYLTWHRLCRVVVVFVMVLFVISPYFFFLGSTTVSAATSYLLEPRSMQMSDSSASANATIATGIGSGYDVTYKVAISNVNAFQSLIINFCDNSPIIGDSCTTSGGMNVTGANVTAISTTCGNGYEVGGAGWTFTPLNSYTVELTSDGSHQICAGSVGSPQTQVFDINDVTNPSTIESFYARIYTYATTSPASATPVPYSGPVGSNVGSYLDYGGIALATTQSISITATVEEILEFCVSGAAQNTWTTYGDCSDSNASVSPALVLGTPEGNEIVLTPEHPWTGEDYFQLSTNALNGATIYMHGSNGCGGLSADGGTTCPITPAGTYCSGSPAAGVCNGGGTTEGTPANLTNAATDDLALFGAQLGNSTDGSSGSTTGQGSLTDVSTYNDGNGTDYGMDDTSGTGVAGSYGNEIAYTSSSCYLVNDNITFGATAALNTPAGIYTDNISLIATGNF